VQQQRNHASSRLRPASISHRRSSSRTPPTHRGRMMEVPQPEAAGWAGRQAGSVNLSCAVVRGPSSTAFTLRTLSLGRPPGDRFPEDGQWLRSACPDPPGSWCSWCDMPPASGPPKVLPDSFSALCAEGDGRVVHRNAPSPGLGSGGGGFLASLSHLGGHPPDDG